MGKTEIDKVINQIKTLRDCDKEMVYAYLRGYFDGVS